MAKTKLIAVDLDDVLSQTNETMRLHVNEQYGASHTKDDYLVPGSYLEYWETIWKMTTQEGDVRYQSYKKIRNSPAMKPVKGALSVLRAMKQRYRLVIVTSRSKADSSATEAWLQQHYYPDIFEGIEYVPGSYLQEAEVTKAMICRQMGVEYLIDDALEHCEPAAAEGITCVLFGEYGWNKYEVLPPNVVHLKSWPDIERYFNEQG